MMDCFDKAMKFYEEGAYDDALTAFKKAVEEGINTEEAQKYIEKLSKGEKSEKEPEGKPSFMGGFKVEINVTPIGKAPKEYVAMKKKYGGGMNEWNKDITEND